MSAVCSAQALLLEAAPNKLVVGGTQAIAPLFDPQVYAKRQFVAPDIVTTQGLLYTASIVLPLLASHLDSQSGSGALNAIVKSLAPCVCLLIKRSTNARVWLASLVAFFGFWLAIPVTSPMQLPALALLFLGMLSGVGLGFTQERYGCAWLEMSGVASAIWLATLAVQQPAWSLQLLLFAAIYCGVSVFVQRLVRAYSHSILHEPLQLSTALNERRALTVLCMAAYQFAIGEPQGWWLVGALLALGGSVVANWK